MDPRIWPSKSRTTSYVRIQDVALMTCQKRWTIGRGCERGSGMSVLAARHDDIIHIFCTSACFLLFIYIYIVTANWLKSQNGTLFRTCEDGVGWHLIPYRISPRSEFFSQAYKTWHITWGINLGPDWPPLARGSKFHTIHTPTRSLNSFP